MTRAASGQPGQPALRGFDSIEAVERALAEGSYLPERGLASAIYLAVTMGRPLLLEGEAGVGKTEVARTLAGVLGVNLIRLQCYEGIDASQALYEWDYARQLLYMQVLREGPLSAAEHKARLYTEDFLDERPLMAAVRAGSTAVLLIDEVDRADDEFEALLLEFLSDFSITVPEIGTLTATSPPFVVLTSNRTRELHDALKRRCFYHWIDYPTADREAEIIRLRVPGIDSDLAGAVAQAISRIRHLDLVKLPGAAEAIDWARALTLLGAEALTVDSARATLGSAIKNHEDLTLLEAELADVIQ